MTSEGRAYDEIRRVLVALDSTRDNLVALEAAAELAAHLEAELSGLFIEDIDVLHLSELPFAREVRYTAVGHRALDRATVEREFRVVAEAARRALEAAAGRHRLRWSFRVVRGQVERELLNAAGESDLVAVGKADRPLTRGRRLGHRARAVTARGPAAVLLTEGPAAREGEPITVTYDASACSERALGVAARLAGAAERTLDVLLLADRPDDIKRLENAVSERLGGSGLAARFRAIAPGDARALKSVLDFERSALLVLGATCFPLPQEELEVLLAETGCAVLLIRA